MKKTRAYRRSQRARVIKRKICLLRKYGGENYVYAWTRGSEGRLAKGKIHCSCRMCRKKSCDEFSRYDKRKLEAFNQLKKEFL